MIRCHNILGSVISLVLIKRKKKVESPNALSLDDKGLVPDNGTINKEKL
jgi:hypothetical protein